MTTAKELEDAFKGPGFGLAFVYYFGLAALIVAIAAMKILHLGAQTAIPYQYGIAFALPFGLINALTKQSRTITISFKKAKKFQARLNVALLDLGFESKGDPDIEDDITYQTFRKSGLAGSLAGEIYVAMTESEAVIASRATLIKKVAARLQ